MIEGVQDLRPAGARRRRANMHRLALVSSMVLLALGTASCGGDDSPEEGGGGGETADPVKIGVIMPLTGPVAAIGAQYEDGVKAALAHVNDGEGVLDRKMELVVRDSRGTPTGAAAAVRDLTGQDVAVIVGDGLSNNFLAQVPVLNQAGIPAISPATADSVWDVKANPWSFSTGDTSRLTVESDVRYLVESRDITRIGMIYETGDFGQSFADATVDVMKSDYPDAELVRTEQFAPTQTNLAAQLSRMEKAGVEGLLVWTFGPGLIKVLQGIDEIGWDVQGATVQGLNDQAVLESVPPSVLDNFAGTNIAKTFVVKDLDDEHSPEARLFFDAFDAHTGKTEYDGTQLQAVPMFDAILLAQQAINAAGSTDPQKIRDALESGESFELSRGVRVFSKTDHVGEDVDAIGLFVGGKPCPNVCLAAPGVL